MIEPITMIIRPEKQRKSCSYENETQYL